MNIKTTTLMIVAVSSFFANSSELSDNDYNKIENTFINYEKSKNNEVTVFDIDNYNQLTEENINYLNILKQKKPIYADLIETILNQENENNDIVINQGNQSAFLYPNLLKPNQFRENECAYMVLITDLKECLRTYIGVKNNLKELVINNNIILNDDYIADFIYIHELAHLLSGQRVIPKYNRTNLWVDNKYVHFGEMYSDLFSVIFLNNHLGYKEQEIDNVLQIRDFKLEANSDLVHYSNPYIKELLKTENWKDLKSFDDIDKAIREIYVKVTNENTISNKNLSNPESKYYNFCKNFNFDGLKTKNVLKFMESHCRVAFGYKQGRL